MSRSDEACTGVAAERPARGADELTNRQFAAFWLGIIISTGGVALWALWQFNQSLLLWTLGTIDLALGTVMIHYSEFLKEEDGDEPS